MRNISVAHAHFLLGSHSFRSLRSALGIRFADSGAEVGQPENLVSPGEYPIFHC